MGSLQKMTIGVLRDKYNSQGGLSIEQQQEIFKQVQSGDMSSIMGIYEDEIKHPLKNAIFGDLVRLMLIQVQHANVTVQSALAALDKLLRSNELNFVVLAVAPATAIFYLSMRAFSKFIRDSSDIRNDKSLVYLKLVMRDIEVLLNKGYHISNKQDTQSGNNAKQQHELVFHKPTSYDINFEGLLLCYTDRLKLLSQILLKAYDDQQGGFSCGGRRGKYTELPRVRSLFLDDIRELESSNYTIKQRAELNIIKPKVHPPTTAKQPQSLQKTPDVGSTRVSATVEQETENVESRLDVEKVVSPTGSDAKTSQGQIPISSSDEPSCGRESSRARRATTSNSRTQGVPGGDTGDTQHIQPSFVWNHVCLNNFPSLFVIKHEPQDSAGDGDVAELLSELGKDEDDGDRSGGDSEE
ncbi:Nuclear control of ATPase protein 2 [Zancudomyces culisetae]|uniref:Nuclear control of ATPase protein 2 n=1 Tax=Zancudomyces culisetae TaxID=1213189 RepID=A0A1R1PQZ5_ZANCU|nr:Nuclear control of ATPase protein 2 [Zancudomyces culisetae]|eukprot:OMH83387.1 Nuclear control of ATPase protein 2 [Zancudomyces culisetae]